MIALVRIALSRPYTFVVLALLLLIMGPLAALRTPTDIFPDIRIPVIGITLLRMPLLTGPGAAIPYPFGGKQRQVQIDLKSEALQSRGLSWQDVANTLAATILITPIRSLKIGGFEYTHPLINSPIKM